MLQVQRKYLENKAEEAKEPDTALQGCVGFRVWGLGFSCWLLVGYKGIENVMDTSSVAEYNRCPKP